MKLKELLNGIPVLSSTADPELEITGVSYDSRATKPGDLFVFKIRNRLNDLYEPYDCPIVPDGNREMKARFLKKQYSTEYAVMKRTGKREYVWGPV